MDQRGFGFILLLVGIAVIIGVAGEIYYLSVLRNPNTLSKKQDLVTVSVASNSTPIPSPSLSPKQVSPTPSSTPIPSITQKTYTSTGFNFQFTYPSDLEIKSDSEEDYSLKNGGDVRKNFTGYVRYEPGKVLTAFSVLGNNSSFENSSFTIWVFDNPNNLIPEDWFGKYWYYPFLWGQFNPPEKRLLAPENETTVGGKVEKYAKVDYQQGSPKYFYIPIKNVMLLIRILTKPDNTGDKILSTFKFTQ